MSSVRPPVFSYLKDPEYLLLRTGRDIIDDDETEDDLPQGGPAADEEEDDMDIDLESEDGYGERGPIHEPSAPTTAQTSARVSPERRSEERESKPVPVKKSKPKEKKAPVPKGRAVKRKAPASKPSKETATDPETRNPYPLEGKFKDEDDRD